MVCSQSAREETSGSTVHAACVASPAPSSYTTSWPAASRDQEPPQGFISASSSSKAPTVSHFHEQPPQCLQNTSRQVPGPGVDQVTHRPKENSSLSSCSLSHSQAHQARCQFKAVGRILKPVCSLSRKHKGCSF